jgi:hypothetical protein
MASVVAVQPYSIDAEWRCRADDGLQPRPSDSDVLTTELMFDYQRPFNSQRCLKPRMLES